MLAQNNAITKYAQHVTGYSCRYSPWLLINKVKETPKQGFKVLAPLEWHTKWQRALHSSTVPYIKKTTLAKVVAVL